MGVPKAPASGEPAWRLERSRSPVWSGDGRASAKVEYAKLPGDLRSKMSQTFWRGLSETQRRTLVETYNRMSHYGVWDQVTAVVGELNEPEPPVVIAGRRYEVAGNSGGIVYSVRDGDALVKSLKDSGHFGEDDGITGAMHPGQRSMREWSQAPNGLHISVNKDNTFDAHIDKVSPTARPTPHGGTVIDPAGTGHHPREVWPEIIRDFVRIPGTIIGSTPGSREGDPGSVGGHVEIGWGGADQDAPLQRPESPQPTAPVDPQVMERIVTRVESMPIQGGLVPPGTPPDRVGDYADRTQVAADIAARVQHAAAHGQGRIEIQLGSEYTALSPAERQLAADEVRRIGQVVVREMGSAADGVDGVRVLYGHPTQGSTEPLR